MHAVCFATVSLLLRSTSQASLFGNPVWASVYALCSNSLFNTDIFMAAKVCITINITRHSMSSTDNSSKVRILTAILSE